MIRHRFTNIFEYVPMRYQGVSSAQANSRREVFDFKDGRASVAVKNGLLTEIRRTIKGNESDWVVCFIPASTKAKTYNRFSSLALFLSRELQCDVFIDAVVNTVDTQSGCQSAKNANPTANFIINSDYVRGKNVILIDDVITRGVTFDHTADKLEHNGARTVIGIFVARTIHPNLPESSPNKYILEDVLEELEAVHAYEDEMLEELEAEQAYENEMLEEIEAEQIYENEMSEEFFDEYDYPL
jgi:phosphoribosylpyrophosphate synthetase